MKERDWLLLVLVAAHGDFLEPLQLQAAMFILWKEKLEKNNDDVPVDYYTFVAGDFNALSMGVYDDARTLAKERLALVFTDSYTASKYCATIRGYERVQELLQSVDLQLWTWLLNMMDWLMKLSFQDLIRYVNNRYPDMTTNLLFRS